MGEIGLAFDDRPTLHPHDAVALALLLKAFGTPSALSIAGKLESQALAPPEERRHIAITRPEQSELFRALTVLNPDHLPERLRVVQRQFAIELGLEQSDEKRRTGTG